MLDSLSDTRTYSISDANGTPFLLGVYKRNCLGKRKCKFNCLQFRFQTCQICLKEFSAKPNYANTVPVLLTR